MVIVTRAGGTGGSARREGGPPWQAAASKPSTATRTPLPRTAAPARDAVTGPAAGRPACSRGRGKIQ